MKTALRIGAAIMASLAVGGAAYWVVQSGSDQAWEVSFFPTEGFQGKPVVEHADTLSFEWGEQAPVSGVLIDQFSVRARTCVTVPHPLTSLIDLTSDDGSRLLIDGRLALDNWGNHGVRTRSGEITLTAGEHLLMVEYFDHSGNATLELAMKSAGGQQIPGDWFRAPGPSSDCGPSSDPPSPSEPRWRASYYDNVEFQGEPQVDEVPDIAFAWGEGPPREDMPSDAFAVRWETCLELEDEIEVGFELTSDDGSRLLVDGLKIIDHWSNRGVHSRQQSMAIPAGKHHLQVDFFDDSSNAMASLRTTTPGGFPLDPRWLSVPNEDGAPCGLAEPPPPSSEPVWRGQYFGNRELVGEPVLVRADPAVAFRWGNGPAADILPVDEFAARWDACMTLDEPTEMQFRLESDDGSRLVVDGRVVVDNWGEHGEQAKGGSIELRPGTRHLRVEYFDGSVNAMVELHGRPPRSMWAVLDGRWLTAPLEPFDAAEPCRAPEPDAKPQ